MPKMMTGQKAFRSLFKRLSFLAEPSSDISESETQKSRKPEGHITHRRILTSRNCLTMNWQGCEIGENCTEEQPHGHV